MVDQGQELDRLKLFWRSYKDYIVYGVILLLGLVYGFNAWQNSKQQYVNSASALYNKALNAYSDGNDKELLAINNLMSKEYSGSIYSDLSSLLVAKHHWDNKEVPLAKSALTYILDSSTTSPIKPIAKARLARISGQPSDLFSGDDLKGSYAFIYYAINGDIHAASGKTTEAIAAYKKAIELSSNDSSEFSRILNYKIQRLVD